MKLRPGNSKRFVTCTGKVDGAGAQAQAVVSVMLFARTTGMTYIHSSFTYIDHNANGDPDWEDRWERFLNFGQSEKQRLEIEESGIPKTRVASPFEIMQRDILYEIPNCYSTWGMSKKQLPLLLEDLRNRFFYGKETRKKNAKTELRVAIHMRRGDVTADGINASRFTQTDHIRALYETLENALKPAGYVLRSTLFSQGNPEQFSALSDLGIELDVTDNPFDTFTALVHADILVTAKSSFSYLAAMLCMGTVLYEPFWHGPLDHWITVGDKGVFDAGKVIEQLQKCTEP